MKIISKLIVTLAAVVMLFGCQSKQVSDVQEYVIDDYIVIVGVKSTIEGKTTIQSHDGYLWDIPKNAKVTANTLTLDSFKKATKSE